MADEKPATDVDRIVKSFSDERGLKNRGIPEDWVRSCADLASQYRELTMRFHELEAELSEADSAGPDDTVVL